MKDIVFHFWVYISDENDLPPIPVKAIQMILFTVNCYNIEYIKICYIQKKFGHYI